MSITPYASNQPLLVTIRGSRDAREIGPFKEIEVDEVWGIYNWKKSNFIEIYGTLPALMSIGKDHYEMLCYKAGCLLDEFQGIPIYLKGAAGPFCRSASETYMYWHRSCDKMSHTDDIGRIDVQT